MPDFNALLPVNERTGVCLVGVVPLVLNFNMRFRAKDPFSAVAQVAKAVREPDVQYLIPLAFFLFF